MNSQLSDWINSCKIKICKEEDQTLFSEAIGCLISGFFRSGYVISWVAIVESLKRKIYQTSNLGDSKAETLYEKIADAESKKQSVDKIILDAAIELKLIDTSEESKLKFLWEQRCIFAHPYDKAPTETDLKFIITALVDICLSKNLLYTKNYINELINNIIEKPYFIANNNEQIRDFARKIVVRVPENLHPFFFKTFLQKLGSIVNDDTKFTAQLKIRQFIVELFRSTSLDLSLSTWTLEQKLISFPYECILGFVHWDLWSKFPDRIKDLILEYAIAEEDENKQIKIRSIIGLLLKNIELESKYKSKFLDKLNSIEFRKACSYYGNDSLLYDRILQEFNTNLYTKQNSVIEFLRDPEGCKFIEDLDQDRQITLGWHIMLSNLTNSWTAQNYLNELSRSKDTTIGIKTGLLYGSVITSENTIYIKKDNLMKMIKLIDRLQEDEINSSFDYIISKIQASDKFNAIKKADLEGLQTSENLKGATNKKILELKNELDKYSS